MTSTESDKITKEKLMHDLNTVISDAQALLRATANETGEKIASARDQAAESIKAAKVRLARLQETMVTKGKVVTHHAEECIQAHPWKSISIAMLVGFFISIFIRRGCCSDKDDGHG